MARAIHVVLFDGFADWEPAHALAELRRWGKREVRSVGFTTAPVVSMGGLRVTPDLALSAVQLADVELLLLPGGDMWQEGAYPVAELEALIHDLVKVERPVAAICAATLALVRSGVLDDRKHTSNGRDYVAHYAPDHRAGAHYVESLAVRDRHVITASGLGAVDFARAIFAELAVFTAENEQLWFDMFKHNRLPATAL
ncbi:MAG TPA: type 1 glutamine amidotransferase family protein [Gemmatimonadaceae bacterium]|jgi:putative intracellular protease/amidase